jgi:hypothetical protein
MEKEKKVYVVDMSVSSLSFGAEEIEKNSEIFMTEAEKLGSVYSLHGFQEALNNEELDLYASYIFIN